MNGNSEPSVSTNLNDIGDLKERVEKLEFLTHAQERRIVLLTEIIEEMIKVNK